MSDQTSPQDASSGSQDTAPDEGALSPEARRILSQRLARERERFRDYGELKAKAERLDEIEEASKSAQQKLIEKVQAAEARAKEMETRSLRAEVAAAKGVPLNALAGQTREELESAAETLIAWRDEAAKSNTLNRRGGFYSGASPTKDAATDPKQRAAAAMREMRRS